MVRAQVPVPEQSPLQPVNADPACAVAVRVSDVPCWSVDEHDVPQLIAVGLGLVTVPAPPPPIPIVSVLVAGGAAAAAGADTTLKVALTAVLAAIVTLHAPAPEQPPPDQPANAEPAAGAAESVTIVPWS
jgi:hypothetical protein